MRSGIWCESSYIHPAVATELAYANRREIWMGVLNLIAETARFKREARQLARVVSAGGFQLRTDFTADQTLELNRVTINDYLGIAGGLPGIIESPERSPIPIYLTSWIGFDDDKPDSHLWAVHPVTPGVIPPAVVSFDRQEVQSDVMRLIGSGDPVVPANDYL